MIRLPLRPRVPGLALVALAAALPLGGCISFGPKPPAELIRLEPAEHAPADSGSALTADRSITILYPTAPNTVLVNRVGVRSGASGLAYLKDAQFADAPTRLFRDLLAETVQARTGRPVLSGRDYHLAPGARLSTQIDTFGVDADARRIDMVVDATLQQPGANGAPATARTRRFEAHAPVPAVTAAAVGPVLGEVANQVARQMADWIGR